LISAFYGTVAVVPNRDLFSLAGKTAVVTGGARGVGVMCAEALLDHGARVVITSRREGPGEESRRQLAERGECELIVADLAKPEGVATLGDELERRFDRLDILVNNAGITWGASFEDYPPEAWTKVLQLDVATPFQVVQRTVGLLEAAGEPGAPARVVNMGSIDGHSVGTFDNFAYPASKAALHHLTRVLAFILAPRNITVNAVAAGPILTKMTAVLIEDNPQILSSNPLRRLAEPDDVAGALVYLTAAAGAYVTGAVIPVDGGFAIPTWGGAHA
jgi:NAD(P)-dependent dehydrogenase (short-subunit alcohol dehydrogenase family)